MADDEIISRGLGLARTGDDIDDIWPSGSSGLVTEKTSKNIPKAIHEPRLPRAEWQFVNNHLSGMLVRNSLSTRKVCFAMS